MFQPTNSTLCTLKAVLDAQKKKLAFLFRWVIAQSHGLCYTLLKDSLVAGAKYGRTVVSCSHLETLSLLCRQLNMHHLMLTNFFFDRDFVRLSYTPAAVVKIDSTN
jgi:hypothetical protein